jgi:hypothetical protein
LKEARKAQSNQSGAVEEKPAAGDSSSKSKIKIQSRYNADFQPCLQYVAIPDLDKFRTQRGADRISELHGLEVKSVLQWLRLVKGVRKILKLHVLDSYHRPHAEEVIEDALDGLVVEELDWKRVDLSIRTVRKVAGNVENFKLHLYSSGSWTPLCHWMSKDGINSLNVRHELYHAMPFTHKTVTLVLGKECPCCHYQGKQPF